MTEYNIIKGLVVIHGYAGIDSRTKVLYLCSGIMSSTLAPVQAMLLTDGVLRHDFTWYVTLFADYIWQDKLSRIHEVTEKAWMMVAHRKV